MTETISVESSPTEEAIEDTQGAEVSTDMQGAWSEFLKSPDDVSAFSPSGDVGGGNLHGLGLQLARERSRAVDRFGRRAAVYIADIASCYDTFGKILLKASQSIHPDTFTGESKSCYESVQNLANRSRRIADYHKTQIVAPLNAALSSDRKSLDTTGQKYVAARSQCIETRRRALGARTSYLRAIRAAEKDFHVWKRAINAAATSEVVSAGVKLDSEAPPWANAIREYGKRAPIETDKLIKKLFTAKAAQTRYQEFVENENDAVAYAQKMEAEALDATQRVETGRIHFFLESVVKPLLTSNSNSLSPLTAKEVETEEIAALDLKRGKDLLANIFLRQTLAYEEGSARSDADTLGLPVICPRLRDNVKKVVSESAAQIKAAQILSEFLESLRSAFLGLQEGLKSDSASTNNEPLGVMALDAMGPSAAKLWEAIVKVFEKEAVVAGECASTLMELRVQKMDVFLESAQRDLKAENDFDDRNWKTLCDIARVESKAAARYRHVKAQQEKARERLMAVDVDKEDEGTGDVSRTPQKNRVSKALFAGGEAMKKLQENARMAMAKNTLSEADQSAAKEQQALDDASAAKAQAVTEYKRVTESRIEKLQQINKAVVIDLEKILESVGGGAEQLERIRNEELAKLIDENMTSSEMFMNDLEDWKCFSKDRIEANRKLALIDAEHTLKESGDGYRMTVVLSECESVGAILTLTDSSVPVPELRAIVEEAASVESSEDLLEIKADASFDSNASMPFEDNVPSQSSSSRYMSGPPSPTGSFSEQTRAVKHTQSVIDEHLTREKQAFLREFWNDKSEDEHPPSLLQIISCSYRPKEKGVFLIPALPGRLYTTKDALYFLSLDGKHFLLPWTDVLNIDKEKGFRKVSDSAIVVTYATADGEAAFVLSRLDARDDLLNHLNELLRPSTREVSPTTTGNLASTPVAPDPILENMAIVLSKPLENVSIKDVYEKTWSEGIRTGEKPFYKPWLEEEECFDISVGEWEFTEDDGFLGPWCNESYTQRRVTTFKFKRTTLLYVGPPVASVKQIHFCRVEGNERCVVAMSATFEGIPYSDCFSLEMRWVARRVGSSDLEIKVGLEVDFKKNTMLKKQIRSATISETKNVHMRMFKAVRRVCDVGGASTSDTEADPTVEHVQDRHGPPDEGILSRISNSLASIPVSPSFLIFTAATFAYPFLWNFFSKLLGAPSLTINEAHLLNGQIQELRGEVRALRASLDLAIELLEKRK